MKDYYSFARTSIGFSHISSKKPCQDYSATFENDIASVIVVSDGHGSNNFTRSDQGSKFACDVAIDAVNKFLQSLNLNDLENEFLRDNIVSQLCKYILLRWNSLVDEDATNNPFTEEEVEKVTDKYKQRYLHGEAVEHAYGCTLILVIITQDFCLAIRNGDGQCVAVDREGCFTTPIPWNDNCEFNVTTSLCDSEAIDNFRYYYSTDLPAAIFAGSDGVDDSYTSVEELYNLYRNICLNALNDGPEAVAEQVEQLLPEITRRGSTDDVSIAGLINPTILRDARTAMEITLELHQIQMAEARKEQQKRIIIRDIKVAEKKKAKAIEQRREVLKKLHGFKESQTGFLEQISIFRKQADACGESMTSLSQDEKQLTDIINGADSEIARLRNELLALIGQAEAVGVPNSNASMLVEPSDVAVTEIDGLLDCDEEVAVKPETDDASEEQTVEAVAIPQEYAEKPAEDNTSAPE